MVEEIRYKDQLISIILRKNYSKEGIQFFTPGDFSQQLGFMKHSEGKTIDPHVHNTVQRSVVMTQEVLVIRKGKLRVDYYNNDKIYLESRILEEGDIVLLASGGHGFQVLEDVEMVEIKQGPYAGDQDKTRFDGISSSRIMIGGTA